MSAFAHERQRRNAITPDAAKTINLGSEYTVAEMAVDRKCLPAEHMRISFASFDAKVPSRGQGDAGYDLYATHDGVIPSDGSVAIVHTGIIVEIPNGFYGRIAPRSGLAVKNNVAVAAGVIDSNYRGAINVALYLTSPFRGTHDGAYRYSKGDRIAQLIIEKCSTPELAVVPLSALTETPRGTSGFGASGQ